jgi:hypothetical protein
MVFPRCLPVEKLDFGLRRSNEFVTVCRSKNGLVARRETAKMGL